MTHTAHLVIMQEAGQRTYKGALYADQNSLLDAVYSVINAAVDLDLMNHEQARFIWRALWRPPRHQPSIHAALARITHILNQHAAPGYEFTAWIIDGSRFWGWFPCTG